MGLIEQSKELMQERTEKNKAPAWPLTEIAVEKGRELAKRYDVDEELIISALYLAHTVFDPIWKGEIQKNHHHLSANYVKVYLDKWGVDQSDQNIIINAIEAHSGQIETETREAEIVKNAECYKFITKKGAQIYFEELKKRGETEEEAKKKVIIKMEQKRKLLTLPECIEEANVNCIQIEEIFK